MRLKLKSTQWLIAALVAAGGLFGALSNFVPAFTGPAAAQFFDDRYPFLERRWRRQRSFADEEERAVNYSRAPSPAPRKADAPTPETKILVMGDSMADWLAYGLEETFVEAPEIAVVRKNRTYSGLVRYENRRDAPDWPQVARETIAAEKPNFIVVILGIQDRQQIREEADKKPARGGAQRDAGQGQSGQDQQAQDSERPSIVAPEPPRGRAASGIHEFRSERWEQLYTKKIDDMIAALKSHNAPVLWVSLPALRGTRSTSDMSYLNELYRARAERAGITYVDVWDGFVDEGGKFVTSGPDVEGQNRRLRTGDGVHFTKYGARKLAHYVEREIRRRISATPVALPMPEIPAPPQQPMPGVVMPRPLAGAQVPLLVPAKGSEELAGGASGRTARPDPLATNVLVRGDPIPAPAGRSDDFAWPRRGVAPVGADPVATMTTVPTQSAKHQEETARAAAAAEAREKADAEAKARGEIPGRQAQANGPLSPQQQQREPQRSRWTPRWQMPFWSLFNTLR